MANPKCDITVRLGDGNAFAIMAAVQRAMRRAGLTKEQITEYLDQAKSKDYDHLLRTTMEFVEVEL